MSDNLPPKPSVVLSGGGSNGAFEIGVLRALAAGVSQGTRFEPLEPSIYSGTSVGAFNAATLASRWSLGLPAAVEQLEDIWRSQIAGTADRCGNGVFRFRGDPLPYLNPRCLARQPLAPLVNLGRDASFLAANAVARSVNFWSSRGQLEERLIEQVNLADFVDNGRFRRLIRDTIDIAALRQSPKSLLVAASNWTSGTVRVFDNHADGDTFSAAVVEASAAIPGVFPPVRVDNEWFVDGGLLMNTPLKPAVRKDATEVHVVFLDPFIADLALPPLPNTSDTLSRSLIILWASAVRRDIETCKEISRTLDVVEQVGEGAAGGEESDRAFLRAAAKVRRRAASDKPRYRRVVLHVYRPRHPIGGFLDFIDFSADRIDQLIELGYETALQHDCQQEGCYLGPDTAPSPRPAATAVAG